MNSLELAYKNMEDSLTYKGVKPSAQDQIKVLIEAAVALAMHYHGRPYDDAFINQAALEVSKWLYGAMAIKDESGTTTEPCKECGGNGRFEFHHFSNSGKSGPRSIRKCKACGGTGVKS